MSCKLWAYLFPDWQVIKVYKGLWKFSPDNDDIWSTCLYEICYSEPLNKFKLRCSGDRPYEHKLYARVISDMLEIKSKFYKK